MKWFLGVAGITGALLVAGIFASVGQSQPVAKADPAIKATHTLTATGSGSVKVSADAARITMKIERRAINTHHSLSSPWVAGNVTWTLDPDRINPLRSAQHRHPVTKQWQA